MSIKTFDVITIVLESVIEENDKLSYAEDKLADVAEVCYAIDDLVPEYEIGGVDAEYIEDTHGILVEFSSFDIVASGTEHPMNVLINKSDKIQFSADKSGNVVTKLYFNDVLKLA